MDHVVKLESIPDLVVFPTDLQDRIHYDPIKKQLVFRGFMCKADYDRLANLNDGVQYRRAIEHLFQISTEIKSPYYVLIKYILILLAALCFILAIVVWWQLLRDPGQPIEPVTNQTKSTQFQIGPSCREPSHFRFAWFAYAIKRQLGYDPFVRFPLLCKQCTNPPQNLNSVRNLCTASGVSVFDRSRSTNCKTQQFHGTRRRLAIIRSRERCFLPESDGCLGSESPCGIPFAIVGPQPSDGS